MGGRDTRQRGRSRWHSCGRKQRYRDEAHARAVAQRQDVQQRAGQLRAYFCSACNGWHLTKQELRSA